MPAVNLDLPTAGGGEKDVAVVVGTSRYAFLPPIPGAADNTRDWAAYLVRVRGVPLDRVHLVPKDEART